LDERKGLDGFANTHANGIVRVARLNEDRGWRTRSWMYGIESGKYVFQYNADNAVNPWTNSYSALFYRENDLVLYERSEAAGFVRRNYGNGLKWTLRGSYQERYPLTNTSDYAFTKGDKTGFRNNLPPPLMKEANFLGQHKALVLMANISWQPGTRYLQYPEYKMPVRSKWPTFSLNYQKGVNSLLDSKVNFDKWKAGVTDRFTLGLGGSVRYNVIAGGFLNDHYVASPDLNHLYGNRGVGLASPSLQSFQFAQYYMFSNKERFYGEAHVEYNLNGLLTNKIPGFRRLNWFLVFGGNAWYANNNKYYYEAFAGFDNIGYKLFRYARFDFVQSWDCYGGRNSGFRLGLSFDALQKTESITGSEW
jgi:hypothetical protein